MAHMDFTFGVEIECYLPEGTSTFACAQAVTARLGSDCIAENYNHQRRPHWKIVTDGSLGDYARGIELVSPVLRGEEGLAQMARVMDALDDFGCTVSRACGLHVHVGGFGSPNIEFFRHILKLYAMMEPVIDSFMPASRRLSSNVYCRSVTNLSFATIDAEQTISGLCHQVQRTTGAGEARYHKLNLTAYARHSTVEFRQHAGTLNANKARNWILLCLRMVDAARNRRGIGTQTSTPTAELNRAPRNSKARIIGDMLLRPEGVTRSEVMAACNWPSASIPQQAAICGLSYTTQRFGREVRYYAQAAAVSAPAVANVAPTLDGLFELCECDESEREYFRTRTRNMMGGVQWAA